MDAARLDPRFCDVIGLDRRGADGLRLEDEASIASAARRLEAGGRPVRLFLNAAGILHEAGLGPERAWEQIDAAAMMRVLAVNTVGPALLVKYFAPLLPRSGPSALIHLSARVGSIGDNRLGGWYSYRASKAALNQIVRTTAVELRRRRPEAVCACVHPGTVESKLSAPFQRKGLDVTSPADAAARILGLSLQLRPDQSGGFFDRDGAAIPW